MSNYNDNTTSSNLGGNPLTSNAAFVPSELDRSQQQDHGLSHHDQFQQTANPVSSHEHHTPLSGHQGQTGSGMQNNFQAVPSSNTAGMTHNFQAAPQHHGQSSNHGVLDGNNRHEGVDSHNTHGKDKREDGSVMDALNPSKGGGMHLPHKGNEEEDRKFNERHGRSDDNFAYRTDPNHPNYEPQTHTTAHINQHGNLPSGATPLTQDPHHAGTRHTDGSAPFAATTGGVHGDQTLLRDHNDSRHDSSVAGSAGARGLSLEESRAHGSGPAYPDAHHGAIPQHATHSSHDPNKRYDNPLKEGSTLATGTTNTHGSHGTTGTYGTPSSGVPGHGGHTGETLPGHNESNPLHKNKDHHHAHDSAAVSHGVHDEHTKPKHNTFATPGHEPTGTTTTHGHDSKTHGHDSTTSHGGVGHDGAHKPTMGEKLKGSVAVLTGKLSGDQEKVAEGQALKTGQPAGGVGSGLGHEGVGARVADSGPGGGVGSHTGTTTTGTHGTGVAGALSEPNVGHSGVVGQQSGVGHSGIGHQGVGHEGGVLGGQQQQQQHGLVGGQHGATTTTGGTQMGALGAGTAGQEVNQTGYQGVPPRA